MNNSFRKYVTPAWMAVVALILTCAANAYGCIWDSDTLFQEKWKSSKMAEIILQKEAPERDEGAMRARISRLRQNSNEADPAWWNELAGAHLRLGEATETVKLLEPIVTRFPNDYGIHANVGTAYHMLGDYAKAERYIARDLEINPDAHFGLEKYHLALLQYLNRDHLYRMAHLYVDEFSESFVARPGIWTLQASQTVLSSLEASVADSEVLDELQAWLEAPEDVAVLRLLLTRAIHAGSPPAYRLKWNLATDPKLEEGVLYMAHLNRDEPAAMTMLGVVCLKKRDLNLAAAAFERAIALKSPQTVLLAEQVEAVRKHIVTARKTNWPILALMSAFVAGGIALLGAILLKTWRRWRLRV